MTSSPTDKSLSQRLESPGRDTQQDQSPESTLDDEAADTPSTTLSANTIPPQRVLYHRIRKDAEGTIVENIESHEPIPTGDTGTEA